MREKAGGIYRQKRSKYTGTDKKLYTTNGNLTDMITTDEKRNKATA